MNVAPRHASAPQADHVQADEIRLLAERESERNDVGAHTAHARNHRPLADTHELNDRRMAAEHGPVADHHVSTKHGIIGEHDVAADTAVMADMRADHEEAAIADLGQAAAVLGADAHGDAFADVAVGADEKPRRTPAVFDGLRRRAERNKWMDDGALTYRRVPRHVDVGEQARALAQNDMGADRAERPDRNIRPDRRARGDPCRRIDGRHRTTHACTIIAPTSASATISPATLASPPYHPLLLRRFSFV